jgi:AAA15 family ATPase/GTPase
MISKVTIQNFKRFKEPAEFVLKPEGVTFLAGGNNSGKSTLLQALAVWEFARSVVEVNKGKVWRVKFLSVNSGRMLQDCWKLQQGEKP